MTLRIGWYALLGFLLAAPVMAQTSPQGGPEGPNGAAGPDQPVQNVVPQLVPRAPQQPQAPRQPEPPFVLTPQEEAQVDRVLNLWEERNRDTKTFDCRFKRWSYDMVFGSATQAKYVDMGTLKYAAPDRGKFRVETMEKSGKEVPVEDGRVEHWICDGRSIFEFKPGKKQLVEHKLPPEMQGKAIADGPLPFLFGSDAKKLKQRYFLRLVTPADVRDQIWIEAYPRYQQDAANFHHAQFIITAQGMAPFALKLVEPNNKDYKVYQFYDVVVNDPLQFFKGDPFRPYTPLGWQRIVEEPPTAQARRGQEGQR